MSETIPEHKYPAQEERIGGIFNSYKETDHYMLSDDEDCGCIEMQKIKQYKNPESVSRTYVEKHI